MQLICERTQELTGADGGTILMRDGDDLVHRAGSGFIAEQRRPAGWASTTRSPAPSTAATARRSATTPASSRTRSPGSAGSGSMIAVPLRHGDVDGRDSCRCSRSGRAHSPTRISTRWSCSRSSSRQRSATPPSWRRGATRSEALARFRTMFEGASIGIVRVDRDGHTLEANPALERMLGYTADELADDDVPRDHPPRGHRPQPRALPRADGRRARLVPAREALLPQGRRARSGSRSRPCSSATRTAAAVARSR